MVSNLNLALEKFYIEPNQAISYKLDLSQINCKPDLKLIFVLAQQSQLDLYVVGIGEFKVNLDLTIELSAEGACANVRGCFLLNQASLVNINVLQNHLAPDCQSYLVIKTALNDVTSFSYTGKIFIATNAQNTVASQINKNLVLAPQVQVKSVPSIEVLNPNVSCSHGSAIGEIDQQEVFYLASRGINPQMARQILIDSFLGF